MIQWLWELWASVTWGQILLGFGLFTGSLTVSFAAIAIVMVKVPKNYFSSHYKRDFLPGSSFIVRWGAVIAKNIFGVFLILLGIVLSRPVVVNCPLSTVI